ncbi:MAG: hypothetical protein SF187_28980 [Deltaproteobacteria bacterium]|nr:hypothetical protein [Deltaproteobacteria bacterium]
MTLGLDGYSFRARWLPCVLVAAPSVIAMTIWLPTTVIGVITSVPLLAAVAAAVSHLVRNKGRDLEPRLWARWGGPPTTQVLRKGSERISPKSLQRYREFIAKVISDVRLPTAEEEKARPGAFDDDYKAITRALINKTRDKAAFPLLYAENVTYGFWRNLLAIRTAGITSSLLGLAVALTKLVTTMRPAVAAGATQAAANHEQIVGAIVASAVVGGLLWFFKVQLSEEQARRAAFNYAERLVEASEHLATKEK